MISVSDNLVKANLPVLISYELARSYIEQLKDMPFSWVSSPHPANSAAPSWPTRRTA
jgi:hypothetical protein